MDVNNEVVTFNLLLHIIRQNVDIPTQLRLDSSLINSTKNKNLIEVTRFSAFYFCHFNQDFEFTGAYKILLQRLNN